MASFESASKSIFRVKTEVKSEPRPHDGIRPNNGFRGGSDQTGMALDDVTSMEMAAYGLPTSFTQNKNSLSLGLSEASSATRKGEKKTFYCELCLVELNSEDTMNSHRSGMKHLKKERAEQERRVKLEKEAGRLAAPERVGTPKLTLLFLMSLRVEWREAQVFFLTVFSVTRSVLNSEN